MVTRTRWIRSLLLGGIVLGVTLTSVLLVPTSAATFGILSMLYSRLVALVAAPLMLGAMIPAFAVLGERNPTEPFHRGLALWVTLSIGFAAAVVIHSQSSALRVDQVVPLSMFEAGSTNALIQLAMFAALFGLALAKSGSRAKTTMIGLCRGLGATMRTMAIGVLQLAPIGVAVSLGLAVSRHGIEPWKDSPLIDSILLLLFLATALTTEKTLGPPANSLSVP